MSRCHLVTVSGMLQLSKNISVQGAELHLSKGFMCSSPHCTEIFLIGLVPD